MPSLWGCGCQQFRRCPHGPSLALLCLSTGSPASLCPPTSRRALWGTFRGLQQTVRLRGASDVGRVGGGLAGAGWGDSDQGPCTPVWRRSGGRCRAAAEGASTHLVTREHHLSAVLHSSLRLQYSLQLIQPWPLPLSNPSLSLPQDACGTASRVSFQLLPRVRLHPVLGPLQPLSGGPLLPKLPSSTLSPYSSVGRSASPGHIIGAQSRRSPRKSFWNLTTIPPAWFL